MTSDEVPRKPRVKWGLRVAEEDDVGRLWSACTHSTRLTIAFYLGIIWEQRIMTDNKQTVECGSAFYVQLDRSPPRFLEN
jgi:hypothetical protein